MFVDEDVAVSAVLWRPALADVTKWKCGRKFLFWFAPAIFVCGMFMRMALFFWLFDTWKSKWATFTKDDGARLSLPAPHPSKGFKVRGQSRSSSLMEELGLTPEPSSSYSVDCVVFCSLKWNKNVLDVHMSLIMYSSLFYLFSLSLLKLQHQRQTARVCVLLFNFGSQIFQIYVTVFLNRYIGN